MPTVLLVDDDDTHRAALTAALEHHGHRVVAVRDAETALFELAAHAIDVSLVDVALPGLDGSALIREVRRRGTTPVIVLSSAAVQREDRTAALSEADAQVAKAAPADELDCLIRSLASSRDRLPSQPTTVGDLTFFPAEQEVVVDGRVIHLERVEMRLLMELASSPMLVHTHEQLVERLFGPHEQVSADVLERGVETLRRVLDEDLRHPPRIVMIRGSGYCFIP